MNAKETLREVKKEQKKAKLALQESQRRCQELLWAMEPDALYGQEKKDGDEVLKIANTMKCAETIL